MIKPIVSILCYNIILFILFSIFNRKISRVLIYISVSLFDVIACFIFFKRVDSIFARVASILICSTFFYLLSLICKHFPYDFNGKILSTRGILNSIFDSPKGVRLIGRVLPYTQYQLKYNSKMIFSTDIATAGGTIISGSSGSGKTFQLKSFLKQDMVNGTPCVFADYKGDPAIANELSEFAKMNGYEVFHIINEETNFNYDPLLNINNTGRIEAILNMRKWSLDGADNHYRTSTQLLLQKTIKEYSHTYEGGENYTYGYLNYMEKYSPKRDEYDSYDTVLKLLKLLITTSLEGMFKGVNEKTFDLTKVGDKPFFVILSFVSSNKELATSFSSLFIKDLLDHYNLNPGRGIRLYMDEFATLDNPFIIKDLLEKGRSAKISTTLALQDINQVIINTNEAYLDSILGTVNNFIIYNGATRSTAEKLAGVQLMSIENVIMNLRKPLNGKRPTALFISKYPVFNKRINSDVFRFEPFIFDRKFDHEKCLENYAVNEPQVHLNEEIASTESDPLKYNDENEIREESKLSEEIKINYEDFI